MGDSVDMLRLELESRKDWSLARLGELVNAGRAACWLPGERIVDVAPGAVYRTAAIETPMRCLATRLALSEGELDLLWILVCIELEPALARAAQILMAPGMFELSAQILERLVPSEAGDMFERLVGFGLIETVSDPRIPLYRRGVRVCDRVLDLARGVFGLDRELAKLATLESAIEIQRATASLNVQVATSLGHAVANASAFVVASGVEGSGRATLLRKAVSPTGRGIISVRAGELAKERDGLTRQLRAIARECRLHDALPLLLGLDVLTEHADLIDRELLSAFPGPVLGTSQDACTWRHSRTLFATQVVLPDEETRAELWKRALPSAPDDVATMCARRYNVSPGLLTRTASAAAALADNGTVDVDHVHHALRGQLERRLLGLAHRVDTRQTWEDLVLPVEQFDLLIELVGRVRHRRQVLDRWGFADKVGKGLGLTALLSGPPGTGKTMIAGLVANELGLDLYQVDLSRVVSKFIGETEKQLAALFEAAESGHAILLFDEADSLFGKRTEVKSSNDRYANLEVNYLLQRMESYAGISLLTTNHETAIDKAFQRRLAFHIRVPMPDEKQRALMWTTMIPERAERAADLDVEGLATEFDMSGGYVKNAVLRAAYLAAHDGSPITNAHLWRAARAEYEAMGKLAFDSAS